MSKKLGLSGAIAHKFLENEITPLLALCGLLLGLFAIMVTPREEEPQIDVTFANIFIPFPGATAKEVELLVSTPAERVLSETTGIKHVFSVSKPGLSVLTVQFKVGEKRSDVMVRLYNKVFENDDFLPSNLGVGKPIIKPKGIDDVPIVTLTLWSKNDNISVLELHKTAHAIENQLKRVQGTRNIYTIGGSNQVVHIELDAVRLAGYGLSLSDIRHALAVSNRSYDAGVLVGNNLELPVQAGGMIESIHEVKHLVVGLLDGHPIYLSDVAEIKLETDTPEQYVWFGTGPAADKKNIQGQGQYPAVTIAFAKKPGTNAVEVADAVIEKFDALKGIYVADDIEVTVTRNYGKTADIKAKTLIKKLLFATAVVIVLVMLFLGLRESFIVGVAILITLAITLFASWAYGFTLNRISLFALIFSIGILVDDAIVVVENIHRHMQISGKTLVEAIPIAVDEIGSSTILATFTVIAALLPMAFVSGLMGPYMSPIPVNASMGMLISLAVAFVVTPWLTLKVLGKVKHHSQEDSKKNKRHLEKLSHKLTGWMEGERLKSFYTKIMTPLLLGEQGRRNRSKVFVVIFTLILLSLALGFSKMVVLKMLPFDNKSEFNILIDMPEGTPLEQTARVAEDLSAYLSRVEQVTDYQAYVGTASPINFNGLVRQYYQRSGSNVGDIQVNLVDKKYRDEQSHDLARGVRDSLQAIGSGYGANIKIVEVPPGPPVQAPIIAEIYGLDYEGQIHLARDIREMFEETEDIVDVDDSIESDSNRIILHIDRQKAAILGLNQAVVAQAVSTALKGEDVSYLHDGLSVYPVPIRIEFPLVNKSSIEEVLNLRVRSQTGHLVPLAEVVEVEMAQREKTIYHKNLLPVVMVTGDMSGELDSPLYGLFDLYLKVKDTPQRLFSQPQTVSDYSVKWDGEWQMTFETFRDMGIAYTVGLILIYLLIVAQFGSYMVPLIIMAPIPLTIIGVMPGHMILGAQFTATSMIGMIALAGIIVRNSILLVNFINQQIENGVALEKATIDAAAIRTKPILLTGMAAMLGAMFILNDPIFSGLAISLIFGISVSTLMTLIIIPMLYFVYKSRVISRINVNILL